MGDHSDSDSDDDDNLLAPLSYPPLPPRPSTPPSAAPGFNKRERVKGGSKVSFATVCSSNINRSMEGHLILENAGLTVLSYGTGTVVKLPGKTSMEPRVFKFGTDYGNMYESLAKEDYGFFTQNGVIPLCRRGAAVKASPTRFQDTTSAVLSSHDVVIAFEERIFDACLEDIQSRDPTDKFKPLHVICLDTKDNPQEAKRQGKVCLQLCWELEHCKEDLLDGAPRIVEKFQEEISKISSIQVLYSVCYL